MFEPIDIPKVIRAIRAGTVRVILEPGDMTRYVFDFVKMRGYWVIIYKEEIAFVCQNSMSVEDLLRQHRTANIHTLHVIADIVSRLHDHTARYFDWEHACPMKR